MKQKPIKNPYLRNSVDFKTWKKGYDHGLKSDKNIKHVDCPVNKTKKFQKIWDQGYVAGRKDQALIPEGPYCYTIAQGETMETFKKNGSYKVNTCPFWGKRYPKNPDKSTLGTDGFCRLTRSTDDFLLGDQCKGCGLKDEYSEQYSES